MNVDAPEFVPHVCRDNGAAGSPPSANIVAPTLVSTTATPDCVSIGAPAITAYSVGDSVVISGLAARADLEGMRGRVLVAPSLADERVAIGFETGEQLRIKRCNVRPSIFPAGFSLG